MCKKIFEILNGTRDSNKPMLKNMCMNCSDYKICLQDDKKCYQYLEEEKRLNAGKEKRLKQRTNNKDL